MVGNKFQKKGKFNPTPKVCRKPPVPPSTTPPPPSATCGINPTVITAGRFIPQGVDTQFYDAAASDGSGVTVTASPTLSTFHVQTPTTNSTSLTGTVTFTGMTAGSEDVEITMTSDETGSICKKTLQTTWV